MNSDARYQCFLAAAERARRAGVSRMARPLTHAAFAHVRGPSYWYGGVLVRATEAMGASAAETEAVMDEARAFIRARHEEDIVSFDRHGGDFADVYEQYLHWLMERMEWLLFEAGERLDEPEPS